MSSQPPLVIIVAVASMALDLGFASGGLSAQGEAGVEAWRQWGGPNRDFLVNVTGLADSWPPEGSPVIWTRPLGTGHSSILADGDRLFTMYRRGDGRSRSGPWEAEETVVAMDAATGATIWEYTYDSGLAGC